MALRRIAYGAALGIALFCQIFDVGYLVHFVFVLVSVLPFVGLALSLPAVLGCRAELAAQSPEVRRGERCVWTLTMRSRFALPLPRVSCRMRVVNEMTGAVWTFRLRAKSLAPGQTLRRPVEAAHCGRLVCRVDRLWVCDCLGLFSLPLKAPEEAAALVCPVPADPGPVTIPEGDGVSVPIPRGKSASGEDYELRPYRPGDNVRAIHWKISAKRDELVVREMLEQRLPLPVLTFDHFGPAEEMERTLDRLAGFSDALRRQGRAHEVRWAEPAGGAVRACGVADRQSWIACLAAVLADRAPEEGRSILERPLSVPAGTRIFHIHITGREARHEET